MEWSLIETAPADGTRIITFSSGGLVGTAKWAQKFAPVYDTVGPGWYSFELDRRFYPTHWMPLPAPPEQLPDNPHKESPEPA